MKAALLIALCLGAALAMTDAERWQYFKNMHGRKFVGMGEENSRFQVFRANLRAAERLQAQSETATYGITQFMDMTPEEFRAQYANLNVTAYERWVKTLPVERCVPCLRGEVGYGPVVDWVNGPKRAVSSVKDQGNCGSCWTFSTAAALEACMMLKNGNNQNVDVSTQQVVDCCSAAGSNGCNGGNPDAAIQWAVARDMAQWLAYPYTARKGTCKSSGFNVAVPANTCKYVGIAQSESAMAAALANAPVAIAVAANPLQYYTGGVLSTRECGDTSVNHAVFLVANDGSAYTVKNSWGTGWGERGYFRLPTGVNCLQMDYLSTQAIPK